MLELVLLGTYNTGIRELDHLVTMPTPGLLLLADHRGENIWQFDWQSKQFLRHYYPKLSWLQCWLSRGASWGPNMQFLGRTLRGLRGYLRGYRVIPLDVKEDAMPQLPGAQENIEGPFHDVLGIIPAQGQLLVIDKEYNKLKTWLVDLVSGKRWLIFKSYNYIAAACTVPLQRVALGGSKRITLLEWSGGRRLGDLPGYTDAVDRMVFSPDGRLLVATGVDVGRVARVKLWDVEHLVELKTWRFQYAHGVTFHPEGDLVAVGCTPALIKLWDLSTDEIKTVDLKSRVGIGALCFSPDGHYLYAGDWQGKLMLFEVQEDG